MFGDLVTDSCCFAEVAECCFERMKREKKKEVNGDGYIG